MSKITLKSISSIAFTEMGKCMCTTNCSKKIIDNTELTKEITSIYANPSLKEIANIPFTEMGKCMCTTNCSKKIVNNTELVENVEKVYKKVA